MHHALAMTRIEQSKEEPQVARQRTIGQIPITDVRGNYVNLIAKAFGERASCSSRSGVSPKARPQSNTEVISRPAVTGPLVISVKVHGLAEVRDVAALTLHIV